MWRGPRKMLVFTRSWYGKVLELKIEHISLDCPLAERQYIIMNKMCPPVLNICAVWSTWHRNLSWRGQWRQSWIGRYTCSPLQDSRTAWSHLYCFLSRLGYSLSRATSVDASPSWVCCETPVGKVEIIYKWRFHFYLN